LIPLQDPNLAFASLLRMTLRIVLLFVVLHVLVGFAFLKDSGPGFPLDDTWIHMVYARSFSEGGGFAYNPGQHETGITAPLWTAMLAAPVAISEAFGRHPEALAALPGVSDATAQAFNGRPDLAIRLLGGILGLLMALVGFRLAARSGLWLAWFASLALTFDATLTFDRFSGMELPLFGLCSLLFVEALIDHRERNAGLMAGILMLVRPEGLLLALLGLVWFIVRQRRGFTFLGASVLCVLPWMGYCYLLSGRPWPATFDVKAVAVLDPGALLASTGALLGDTGWGWALPLAALVGIFSLEGGRHSLGMLVLGAGSLLFVGVLLTRPLAMAGEPARVPFYWARYTHIAWPLILLLASTGLSTALRTAVAGLRCRPHYMLVLVAPLALLLFLGRDVPAHTAEMQQRFAAECLDVERLNVAAGRWIAAHTETDAVVATHDAGAVRYFGKRRTVDIFGNQAHKLLQAERKGADAARGWLLAWEPDVLAVFPAQWARDHSPELKQLWADSPPGEGAALLDGAEDYAEFFGLTQRAITFHVDEPATVPSPLHADLAIFVAP
jgi:hypothetical protein